MAEEALSRAELYIHRVTNAADAAAGKNKRKRSLSYEGAEKAKEELKQKARLKARLKSLEEKFKNMTKNNFDEDGDDTMGGII